MQRRYPERTNSMREKRSLEGGEDELPERKRPALARYITYFFYFFDHRAPYSFRSVVF